MRLNFPAQLLVTGGQRHLHHAFRRFVYFLQEIQIPQYAVRLCDYGKPESIPFDQGQRLSDMLKLHLQRNIGVSHGSRVDHAFLPLAPQGMFQQFDGILLDLDILEVVLHMVAPASGIAVDTPVGTAPVQIHSVLGGQNPFRRHKMHPPAPHFPAQFFLCAFSFFIAQS